MEAFLWAVETRDPFFFSWPFFSAAFLTFVFAQSDFAILLTYWFWRLSWEREGGSGVPSSDRLPPGWVVIPSLLRNREDFNAVTVTIDACATNGYPNTLAIIASIDGVTEEPELYRELCEWVERQRYPNNVRVHVGGNRTRLGKMMAVEAGVQLMKELVEQGAYPAFPDVYFSMDGDGTLSPRSLELLVRRLTKPHRVSGNPRRVVSGKVCIRPDAFWKGWNRQSLRDLFTIEGQIYLQVAREFVHSNVTRFNLKLKPQIGIPGALYCCWSEILLQGPRMMGFMRTLRWGDWARWWMGLGAPKLSESQAAPLPEAMTGASDDTCVSFFAAMSSWKDGKLTLDAPRSPAHALGRLVKAYLWERSPDYEPESRVYTYTPTTLKTLWVQRVRWNASRLECAFRFRTAFAFHWEVGIPVTFHVWTILWNIFLIAFFYVLLPYHLLATTNGLLAYAASYAFQMFTLGFYTFLALVIEKEWRRYWPVMLALPLAPLHSVGINFFACVTGVVKDLLLFGNTTKFAPEWTFKKGGTVRIALLFRIRRFLALCVRAIVVGDVPWGSFWFGWRETPWTPSGYEGWTTGKKQRPIVPPVSTWIRRRNPAPDPPPTLDA